MVKQKRWCSYFKELNQRYMLPSMFSDRHMRGQWKPMTFDHNCPILQADIWRYDKLEYVYWSLWSSIRHTIIKCVQEWKEDCNQVLQTTILRLRDKKWSTTTYHRENKPGTNGPLQLVIYKRNYVAENKKYYTYMLKVSSSPKICKYPLYHLHGQ